jgi:hypothetical protein
MARLIHNAVRAIGDGIVRAESAVLERPARTLDDVGTPILVASHRRSGTHLTLDLLRRNFPACRPRMLPLENPHFSYLNLDRFEPATTLPCTEREALRILSKSARPLLKTHAEPGFADGAPEHDAFVRALAAKSKTIYVHRDGKKVMCSMWTWRRVFDERARVPFAEFIRQTDDRGRSRVRVWADHVRAWRETPGVLMVEFDRIVRDAPALLIDLGAFIGETPVGAGSAAAAFQYDAHAELPEPADGEPGEHESARGGGQAAQARGRVHG